MRDFQINGESMVRIKFGSHMSGRVIDSYLISGYPSNLYDLGLSVDQIKIAPTFHHVEQKSDDFGPNGVPETRWEIADCRIDMDLVHYDPDVLDACMVESMGGGIIVPVGSPLIPPTTAGIVGFNNAPQNSFFAGVLPSMGTPMGGNFPPLSSGNHYMSLSILSPQGNYPYRFPTAYMPSNPLEIPLGTNKSIVRLSWRAIPYRYHVPLSNGGVSTLKSPAVGTGVANIASISTTTLPYSDIISSGSVLFDHGLDSFAV